MLNAVADIFQNVAVLCAGAVVLFLVGARTVAATARRWDRLLLGAALGAICYIVVRHPIESSLGGSFDTRAAAVIMASYLGGPISGLLAATVGAFARYQVGGPAVVGGMASFYVYVATGLLVSRFSARTGRRALGLLGWAGVGVAAAALASPCFFLGRPLEAGLALLRAHWPILLVGNVAGVAVLGLLMEEMRRIVDDARARADALEAACERQELLNKEMEKVLYAVAHDLKGPLVTVRGFAGLLDRTIEKGDLANAKDCSTRILRASEKLGAITEGLMQYGGLGAEDPPRETIELGELLAQVGSMLNADIVERAATLTFVGAFPRISGAPDDVLRVALNLIGNALKHGCPRPGMTVEVSVESDPQGVVLVVADHGPGVDKAFRTEVFRLFRRLDPAKREGVGLGLAIVEKIVQRQGGWCAISETAGGGATVRALIAPSVIVKARAKSEHAA